MNKLDHSGIHASRSLGRGLALLIGQAHEAPVRVSRPMSRSRGETIARCVEQLVAGGEALRYIPALNDAPAHIAALKTITERAMPQ